MTVAPAPPPQPSAGTPIVVQVLAVREPSGAWSAGTLELLGDAAALARRWHGRVAAWVLGGTEDVPDVGALATHGCSVVWYLYHERLRQWASEAISAVLAAHLAAECRVVLLPGTAPGEEVAALLAENRQTAWVPDALTLAVTRSGGLEITAALPGGKLSRVYRPPADRPVVVTIRPGVAEPRPVTPPPALETRIAAVDLSTVPELTAVERFLPADPRTVDLVFAQRIVSAGRGAGGPDGIALVAQLAESLGASLGASRMVVDLGWLPAERQVGQTGRTVHPDLYVACGISGASHHLAGMRESKHIVAINPDAAAPIHDVAHLSLRGDLHQVIPAIRMVLQRRFPQGAIGSRT